MIKHIETHPIDFDCDFNGKYLYEISYITNKDGNTCLETVECDVLTGQKIIKKDNNVIISVKRAGQNHKMYKKHESRKEDFVTTLI